MSAGLGHADKSIGGQQSVIQENNQIATGAIESIISNQFKKEHIDQLKSNFEEACGKIDDKRKIGDCNMVAYTASAWRDAVYAISGRMHMRVHGLTGKNRAAFGRALALDACEELAQGYE